MAIKINYTLDQLNNDQTRINHLRTLEYDFTNAHVMMMHIAEYIIMGLNDEDKLFRYANEVRSIIKNDTQMEISVEGCIWVSVNVMHFLHYKDYTHKQDINNNILEITLER